MSPTNGPGAGSGFILLSYDRYGALRDDDGLLAAVERRLRHQDPPVTDVFVFSHGWLNDQPKAVATYQRWVAAMTDQYLARKADFDTRRPGFRPLLIGLHWPSAPWEDPYGVTSVRHRAAHYTHVIGDPAAEDDLVPLLEDADRDPDAAKLSDANEERLQRLDGLAGLRKADVGAAPGQDRAGFEARQIVTDFGRVRPYLYAALDQDRRSGGVLRTLLSPLWVTSFWAMKNRAVTVGSTGVHQLVRTLQAAGAEQGLRIHLIGHSFGSIVLCAALKGPERGIPAAPVYSLTLLQGALSLWSFARPIPDTHREGYFCDLVDKKLVTGPTVTTQSEHDTALAWFFRMAATAARRSDLGPEQLPRYGAVGSYGLGGVDARAATADSGQVRYLFEAGARYNVECSRVIVKNGLSLQGAHSNLVRAELAGLVWEGALAAPAVG
ncbi:hypothetical protein ABZT28_34235 [Streptomyces sp. NPDC005388]|uniref:hypothetical protein n=1 Tax=Streptomyces sp. NPDC005388 TaxID=3156717 RepID=UPI0033A17AAA